MPKGWVFGAKEDPPDRDFILLQTLASRFRTALTTDIASREKPAATEDGLA